MTTKSATTATAAVAATATTAAGRCARRVANAALLAAVLCGARPARAWDGPGQWWKSASAKDPGAGGIYGTGGQGDYGIRCTDCHVKTKGTTMASLTPSPAWGSMGGVATYKPGQRYDITVKLLNEYLGLSGCGPYSSHVNNFAATFEDADGKPAGVLQSDDGRSSASCPSDPPDPKTYKGTTTLYHDCRAVVPGFVPDGTTTWKFSWTAPASGAGDVTIFAGVGDGDCKMDSFDDDMKVFNIPLKQGTALAPVPRGGGGASGTAPARAPQGSGSHPWRLAGLVLGVAIALPGGRLVRARRRAGRGTGATNGGGSA